MAKVLKDVKITWTWQGDEYALKGFNIAITEEGKNPNTDSLVMARVGNVREHTFRGLTPESGKTYVAWVQAIYEGDDSEWLSTSGIVVEDDGTATIETVAGAAAKAGQAENNAKGYAEGKAQEAEENAKVYADGIKANLAEDISDLESAIGQLDTYIDGAFHDNVVSQAEAKSIEKYLNQLTKEKAEADEMYNTVYNNPDLTGDAKTNLASAKSAWDTAHTNLINSINSAIADGKTTPAEKADVDAKFTAFRTASATLAQRMEEALDAIAQAKASAAEQNAKDYASPAIKEMTNPYFEQGKRFWTTSAGGDWSVPEDAPGTIVSTGEWGGKALELQGDTRLYWQVPQPVDVNHVYKVRFKVRQTVDATAGDSRVYAGVRCLDKNYVSLGNNQYCAAWSVKITVADGWKIFEGIITGTGSTANTFIAGTTYVRPMFIVNYQGGNGVAQVDGLEFIDITQEQNAKNYSEKKIDKSSTAPANPATGDLWLDTSKTPNILKRWSGSAWVKASPTEIAEINNAHNFNAFEGIAGGGSVKINDTGIWGYDAQGNPQAGFSTDGRWVAGGGRVVADAQGLRGNNGEKVTFQIDTDGNAFFEGELGTIIRSGFRVGKSFWDLEKFQGQTEQITSALTHQATYSICAYPIVYLERPMIYHDLMYISGENIILIVPYSGVVVMNVVSGMSGLSGCYAELTQILLSQNSGGQYKVYKYDPIYRVIITTYTVPAPGVADITGDNDYYYTITVDGILQKRDKNTFAILASVSTGAVEPKIALNPEDNVIYVTDGSSTIRRYDKDDFLPWDNITLRQTYNKIYGITWIYPNRTYEYVWGYRETAKLYCILPVGSSHYVYRIYPFDMASFNAELIDIE